MAVAKLCSAEGKGLLLPSVEALRSGCEGSFNLLISVFDEALHELAVVGVDALITHGLVVSSLGCGWLGRTGARFHNAQRVGRFRLRCYGV
jgi:hypothetical protein